MGRGGRKGPRYHDYDNVEDESQQSWMSNKNKRSPARHRSPNTNHRRDRYDRDFEDGPFDSPPGPYDSPSDEDLLDE